MDGYLKMSEIAKVMGVSVRSARRALLNSGVPVRQVGQALMVEEDEFSRFLLSRTDYAGRGRPKESNASDRVDDRIGAEALVLVARYIGEKSGESPILLLMEALAAVGGPGEVELMRAPSWAAKRRSEVTDRQQ